MPCDHRARARDGPSQALAANLLPRAVPLSIARGRHRAPPRPASDEIVPIESAPARVGLRGDGLDCGRGHRPAPRVRRLEISLPTPTAPFPPRADAT